MDHVIITVGEDGTMCLWDYAGNRLHRHCCHRTRGLWSVAATLDGHSVLAGMSKKHHGGTETLVEQAIRGVPITVDTLVCGLF